MFFCEFCKQLAIIGNPVYRKYTFLYAFGNPAYTRYAYLRAFRPQMLYADNRMYAYLCAFRACDAAHKIFHLEVFLDVWLFRHAHHRRCVCAFRPCVWTNLFQKLFCFLRRCKKHKKFHVTVGPVPFWRFVATTLTSKPTRATVLGHNGMGTSLYIYIAHRISMNNLCLDNEQILLGQPSFFVADVP